MNGTVLVVEGMVKPDGTLELDERLNLPPGRVRLLVQAFPENSPAAQFWAGMQTIWTQLRAAGYVPRSKEEIDAELKASRDQSEVEISEVEAIHFEAQANRSTAKDSLS